MADDEEKPKKKIPLWIVILAVSQVLIFVVGGTAFYIVNDAVKKENRRIEKKLKHEEFIKNRKPEAFPLETFRVNLAESKTGFRFFELQMVLQVLPGQPWKEVLAKKALIREEVNFFLSTKTEEELTQKDAQKILREDLLMRINTLLIKGKVEEIFFSQYLLEK